MNLFFRIFVIMALGAWTIWPASWGLAVWTFNLFGTNPVLAAGIVLLWTVIVFTVLPLSLRQFKLATQVSLVGLVLLLHYQAYAMHFFVMDSPVVWGVSLGLSAIFILIAWPMIANRLWQWTHYQRAVDPQVDNPETADL